MNVAPVCRSMNLRNGMIAAVALLVFAITGAATDSPGPITADLHQYGVPNANMDRYRLGIFYLSNDRLALFFEEPVANSEPESHSFQVLVFNTRGEKTAQANISGNPKAIDIARGPDKGLMVGKQDKVELYDSQLLVVRSIPLNPATTGIAFDPERNQLIVQNLHQQSGYRTAEFVNPSSLERSASLNYPINARAVFGSNELVYTTTGECSGSTRVVSKDRRWQSTEVLPLCDSLTFIGDDQLAYASANYLFIVNPAGEQVFKARIPVPSTFQAPAFVGLSEDHKRLAIVGLDKKRFASGWPFVDRLFVYDLASKQLIFHHTLPQTPRAASLSPDGHQLATIEEGVLVLTNVP